MLTLAASHLGASGLAVRARLYCKPELGARLFRARGRLAMSPGESRNSGIIGMVLHD